MAIDDPALRELIHAAADRLCAEMTLAAPYMAGQVMDWGKSLAGSAQLADYFLHPAAFPSLALPWWLEKTLRPAPDLSFQTDLIYSTLNGYYYIRLLDNLMDGDTTVEQKLLPAAAFFHTQFQAVYQPYFEPTHPFWGVFKRVWFHAAESTLRDAQLDDIDLELFNQVAGQKLSPVKIPLAAVCYRYGCPDRISPWSDFCDRLGSWHQMWNDLFSWNADLRYHIRTYFLCEAERRKRAGETVMGWIAREGFAWGNEALQSWLVDLKTTAVALNSPALNAYLDQCAARLRQKQAEVEDSLPKLAAVMAACT